MNETLNVMEMVKNAASSTGVPAEDLFITNDPNKQNESSSISSDQRESKSVPVKRKPWVPDAELTEGLSELHQEPMTYDSDEIRTDSTQPLRNLADDDAIESSVAQRDEMTRMMNNIELAKKRFGISKLQIPPGKFQVIVYNAASDGDSERAAKKLDELFEQMINLYPEFIYEYEPGKLQGRLSTEDVEKPADTVHDEISEKPIEHCEQQPEGDNNDIEDVNEDEAKVIIDKRSLPEVSWSKDDIDKVRKARTVELNIVEETPIKFSEIDEADQNTVDRVISQYVRKNNDVTASLPASRYRCTFTGLSYPEIMDLANSVEMNNVDGERKKWSICFKHMKNMSIGEWKEYRWYRHPVTGRVVKLGPTESVPGDIYPAPDVHTYTKFEDFLRHTSFMDLNFMIWKILCATCLSTEIIQIDCHAALKNGGTCNNNYDWIYSPPELLELDSISPTVLEEMQITGEAAGDAILDNYNESFLMRSRTVELPESGLLAVFGHASAYEYLENIYPAILNVEDDDPASAASRRLNYITLTIIKGFLVKNPDGKYSRIAELDHMLEILDNMGEIDWQTIGELVGMTMKPYDFKYSLRGLVCPKCKNRSKISIDHMSKLLFIAARSLSSVSITFKTN